MCVRSISRKSRDLDAFGSREVMVVMIEGGDRGDGGVGGDCGLSVSVSVSVSVGE